MAEIEVTVVRADTNQAYDVALPDHVPVGELLAELVREMGMPRLDSAGELVAYELSSKRTGDGLRDGSLASRGVKPGDVLLLTSTFVAGAAS